MRMNKLNKRNTINRRSTINRIILALILLSVLIISACEGSNPEGESQCYGAEGIVMSFDQFSQYEVTGTSGFPASLGIDLENKGPSLADVAVDVRGIDYEDENSIFDVSIITSTDSNKFILNERDCKNPSGDTDSFAVDISLKEGINLNSKTFETPAEVAICYQYSTVYDKPVCVKGTEYRTGRSGVCEPDNQIFIDSYGQGSPVVVSNIEYEATVGREKVKHTYRISFEKGRTKINGDELRVYPLQSGLCEATKSPDFDDRKSRNKIFIEVAKLGVYDLECNYPDKENKLFEIGRQPLNCWVELSNSDSIKSPLYIKASYEVEDSITKDSIKFEIY